MLLHAVRDAGVCNRASGQTNKTNVEPSVGTVRRNKRTKTNQIKRIQPKKKMRRSAGESEQMLSAGRRDKQKEQERPPRPGDGGDELRGRTDPEMAVTSSATNM